MNTPNAHDARTLLDRAEATSRQAAGFSFAWLSYLALCAGGAITSVGLAYATTTSPPSRRGFGSRWTIMMAAWVILWTITSVFNAHFTLGQGVAMAAAFLAAAAIGLVWEVVALKKGVK